MATLAAIAKAVGSFYFYFTGDVALLNGLPLAGAETWLWRVVGVLHLAAAFALIAIMRWQQWGFYALCIITVIASVAVYAAGAGPIMSLAALFGGAVALGILYGLLSICGPRSIWAQME